jgi:hypothetical protein
MGEFAEARGLECCDHCRRVPHPVQLRTLFHSVPPTQRAQYGAMSSSPSEEAFLRREIHVRCTHFHPVSSYLEVPDRVRHPDITTSSIP